MGAGRRSQGWSSAGTSHAPPRAATRGWSLAGDLGTMPGSRSARWAAWASASSILGSRSTTSDDPAHEQPSGVRTGARRVAMRSALADLPVRGWSGPHHRPAGRVRWLSMAGAVTRATSRRREDRGGARGDSAPEIRERRAGGGSARGVVERSRRHAGASAAPRKRRRAARADPDLCAPAEVRRSYSSEAVTSTEITGSTSGSRCTVTSCVPTERIGSSRWTSCRSTANPGLRLDRLGDVGRRDAAEQPALLAGVRRDRDGRRRQARGDLFRLGLGRVRHGCCGRA